MFPLDMDHPAAKPLHPSRHDHSWISPDVPPSFYVTCLLTHLFSYSKHSSLILQACPCHCITSSIYVPSKVFPSFNSLILSSHSHSSGCSFSSQLLVVHWSALVHIHMSAPHNHMDTYKAHSSLARYSCVNQPLYFEVRRAFVVGVISNRRHKRQSIRYYYWDKQMCNGSSTGNLVQQRGT